MIDDVLIESIAQIGNSKRVIEKLEPDMCYHATLDECLIRRVLYAQELLLEVLDKEKKNDIQRSSQGDSQQSKPRRGKSVHKVPAK